MKGDESLVKPVKIGGSLVTMAALIFCFVQPVKAEDLPIDKASAAGATISEDVDIADNAKPDMSTDFFLYIPPDPIAPDPNEPVGVIEIDRPGNGGKYGSTVEKPFPQTGGAESSAPPQETTTSPASSLVKTVSDTTPQKFLIENGKLYVLKAVNDSVIADPLQETRNYTGLSTKEVPESIEIESNGEKVTLSLRDVQYEEVATEVIEGSLDHGYTLYEPSAPETKEITYTDSSGMEMTVSAALVNTEQVEGYAWRDIEFPIRYYGNADYSIFQLDDTFIPYQDDAPYWEGTDGLVTRHLSLNSRQWKLTGSAWTSDWTGELLTGRSVRYGVLYGQMYAAHWVSHYEVPSGESGTATYTATATYTGDQDTTVIEAVYTAFASLPLLAGAAVGLLLLLIFIIVLLFLVKRKRKDKNGQRNTGNQG